MALSNEEQILLELRSMNAQLNPGKAAAKAFALLVFAAIAFTVVAALVNTMAPPSPVIHSRPASRGGHGRPSLHPHSQLIKESYQ
jgi:hypothetical protein